MHINSPGGTTAGSEQLYDALMQLKAKKPLVVVVEGLAASGGYITAIASDHIVAQQTSLVGSIGVLFQFPNVSESAQDRRREDGRDQVLAAEGGAQRLRADQPGGARRDRRVWSRIPAHGSADLVKERRGMDDAPAGESRRRPRLHRPPGGRSQADRSARRREDRDRLAGRRRRRSRATCRCAITSLNPRFSDLTFLRTAASRHARCVRPERHCAAARAGRRGPGGRSLRARRHAGAVAAGGTN